MTGWSASDGLATLGPDATALLAAVDAVFTGWAAAAGADPVTFPPLLRVAELDGLDYFRNFPHLGTVVTRIRPDRLDGYAAAGGVAEVPAGDTVGAEFALPSAACYAVYLDLAGARLDAPRLVTTVARCFRNEAGFDGLRRLWGFQMREIVCVGPARAVRDHLERHHDVVAGFAARLGLPLRRAVATDPFFRADDPKAVLQLLEPVKDEYVHADGTAVASMNYHRNFFGERCRIAVAGEPAFTGCVAFGLERWVHALGDRFGGDLVAAREAVAAAGGPA